MWPRGDEHARQRVIRKFHKALQPDQHYLAEMQRQRDLAEATRLRFKHQWYEALVSAPAPSNDYQQTRFIACRKCGSSEGVGDTSSLNHLTMLLCDCCNGQYHYGCLQHQQHQARPNALTPWLCPPCTTAGLTAKQGNSSRITFDEHGAPATTTMRTHAFRMEGVPAATNVHTAHH
jgi:hypothetical protein